MRYTKLFGKTIKDVPKQAKVISYQLLYKGGFIRESTSGRYFFLPLGRAVEQKIVKIVKDEMDRAGAQELITPVLHPLSLWEETNRDRETGFELMKVEDRRGVEFALGGTAEEMFVDLVRHFQLSYRDLPLNLYQFSSKFRDELRSRGGLLRVREFLMKDAYSFHTDEKDFQREYKNMRDTYSKIFQRMGLDTIVVESDNGYIGGDYCHEFVVESKVGESRFLLTKRGNYAAHEDVARFTKDKKNTSEQLKVLEEVAAKRGTTMEDGVKLHKKPLWQQIKDVLFVDERGKFILAIIRGDYDVNEVKLRNIVHARELRHATDDEIQKKINSAPGFISPIGIKDNLVSGVNLTIVADDSLKTIRNAYGGANKRYRDFFNMNIDRDYKPDIEGDIAMAKEGYIAPDGKQKLIEKRGIEVGNIFQLGYHYSKKMKGSMFIDKKGEEQLLYMGCYGIGIGRSMAAIVEIHHDSKGITWPKTATPYQVHLVSLDVQDKSAREKANKTYESLLKEKIEVLFDDREDVTAGEKFADADLIGIPIRLVISKKTGEKVEWKERSSDKSILLTLKDTTKKIRSFYNIL